MSADLPHRGRATQPVWRVGFLALSVGLSRCECRDGLQQLDPVGNVEGYICHPVLDELVEGAVVSGEGPRFQVDARTDQAGYFVLVGLAAGPQSLDVAGSDFVDTIDVEVVAEQTVRVPDPSCLVPGTGTIAGRICATQSGIGSGEGYWLANARVFIVAGTDVYEVQTGADGSFALDGVPIGTHTLLVEKGSFSASTTVIVQQGEVTHVEHVCVAPSTQIAVVTGQFDEIQSVLEGMGFGIAACLPSGAAWCPTSFDPSGTVTLVEGDDSSYFITDFLDDSLRLDDFDILFFNCGLSDQFVLSAPPSATSNLRQFVQNGGSIYASDWAYEIVRVVFPGELDFYGDDTGAAYRSPDGRVGVLDAALAGGIVDSGLEAAIGSSAVDLVYNKGDWVPLDATQPASVYTWITADVPVDTDDDPTTEETWTGAPVLVSTSFGNGRIVYTTFHTHQQVTVEMTEILRYIVFEL